MFKATEYSWRGKQASGFTAFRRERRPSNPSIINNGLQYWYDFGDGKCYPGTGTSITDLSTIGNNATVQSTSTFSPQNGGIFSFNGTSDYLDGQIANIASAGTVQVWVNKTGTGSPDAAFTIDLAYNVTSDGRYGWSAGMRTNTNKINFYIANNGNYGTEDFSTQALTDKVWYFVCYTYDGTNKRIYINGAQDSVFASTVNGRSPTQAWAIAGRPTVGAQRYFQGLIGHTSVYNRALSASEVKLNFDATRVRYGV